jgi:hypothetical protein
MAQQRPGLQSLRRARRRLPRFRGRALSSKTKFARGGTKVYGTFTAGPFLLECGSQVTVWSHRFQTGPRASIERRGPNLALPLLEAVAIRHVRIAQLPGQATVTTRPGYFEQEADYDDRLRVIDVNGNHRQTVNRPRMTMSVPQRPRTDARHRYSPRIGARFREIIEDCVRRHVCECGRTVLVESDRRRTSSMTPCSGDGRRRGDRCAGRAHHGDTGTDRS